MADRAAPPKKRPPTAGRKDAPSAKPGGGAATSKPKPAAKPAGKGAGRPSAGRAPDVMATVRNLYLRALGVLLAVAFVSIGVQAGGLIGPDGLAPSGTFLGALGEAMPTWPERLAAAPTLAWFLPDAWAPQLLVGLGLLGALGPLSGRFAGPGLLLAWASHLSLVVIGQRFLSEPADALLCELTWLSALVAPWRAVPLRGAPVAGWWALRLLWVKLVFLGGLTKVLGGDPAWRDLSALAHQLETQPLPNGLAWSAHQLPPWLLQAGALATLVVELLLVWGALGPRRARLVAFAAVNGVVVAQAATGSHGSLPLATLVLSLALLRDEDLRALRLPIRPPRPMPLPWANVTAGAMVGAWGLASVVAVAPRFVGELPAPLDRARAVVAPWRSVNAYGASGRVPTERLIPVLEARWGDEPWQELTWRWQTSDPLRAPAQVAPHAPRLDTQLAVAGLGTCAQNPWLTTLQDRLLEGAGPVARLVGDLRLQSGRPPTAVRLVAYRYRFAPPGAEAWWTREPLGVYCPERAAPPAR